MILNITTDVDDFIKNYRKQLNTKDFFFKETIFGNVLMISEPIPLETPGEFTKKWRKATKEESLQFLNDMSNLAYKALELKKLKEENPEMFL